MGVTTGWEDLVDPTGFSCGAGSSLGDGELVVRGKRSAGSFEIQGTLTIGATTVLTDSGPNPIFLVSLHRRWLAYRSIVTAEAFDASEELSYPGIARVEWASGDKPLESTNLLYFYCGSGVGPVDRTVPFTWAAGDTLKFGNAVEAFDN